MRVLAEAANRLGRVPFLAQDHDELILGQRGLDNAVDDERRDRLIVIVDLIVFAPVTATKKPGNPLLRGPQGLVYIVTNQIST
jgi:hypothetical protein